MDTRFGPKRRTLPCFTAVSTNMLVLLAATALLPHQARAAEWPSAYIRALPDDAFAAIETAPGGRRLRHLPHHDHTGALDPPHLRSALARWHQVKWRDPAAAAAARAHLDAHRSALRAASGRAGGEADGTTGP
ncbi:MAG: hypothetical protein HYT86_06155 [candidate division NC10 bacterium]|nr:hypothetical protein [candidate division NC10 bacterium]